jgi:hypothetical protein
LISLLEIVGYFTVSHSESNIDLDYKPGDRSQFHGFRCPKIKFGCTHPFHIYNTADAVGLTQTAVAAVVAGSEEDTGVEVAIAEWQKRRDVIVDELSEYNLIPAAGGWSMLLEVGQLGFTSVEASERLLSVGKIAATYMRDWGQENSDQYVRLVFSKEPVERLPGIGDSPFVSMTSTVTVRNGHNRPVTQTIQRDGLSRVLVGLSCQTSRRRCPSLRLTGSNAPTWLRRVATRSRSCT